MPGEGRVCNLAEVYDSKEFTGVFKSQSEITVQGIYKISQKTSNHLHSLGVLHRKKRCSESWGEADCKTVDVNANDLNLSRYADP